MNQLKLLFMSTLLVLMASCAVWNTPSIYSNTSTAEGVQVNAQGEAARYAASANTSSNCLNCTVRDGHVYNAYGQYVAPAPESARDKARREYAETVTWRLNRALDQALFRLLQDY